MRRSPSPPSASRPWLPTAGLIALFATSTPHAEVWIITDGAHPVAGQADRQILLDAPALIEAELTSGLPSDPARAENIARDRLNQGGAALQHRIADASQGVTNAWRLGITGIPAVVVDQRYVIYGEPDVAKAVARIQQYRQVRP